MPRYLQVRNWDRWQTYRNDRTPPWIKLHRGLLLDPEWQSLTDAEKGALVSIWILAAQRNGRIPDDAKLIQNICNLDFKPDLTRFLSLQFLEKIGNRRRRAIQTHVALDVDVDVDVDVDKKDPPLSPPAGTNGNGSRLPENWSLPDEWRAWAEEKLSTAQVMDQAARFRDHWIAQSGARGVKRDWQATWRNWIRRSNDFGGSNGTHQPRLSAVERVRRATNT